MVNDWLLEIMGWLLEVKSRGFLLRPHCVRLPARPPLLRSAGGFYLLGFGSASCELLKNNNGEIWKTTKNRKKTQKTLDLSCKYRYSSYMIRGLVDYLLKQIPLFRLEGS